MDDWVTIIHAETGATGVVHRSSLPQHYASGWQLPAGDGEPVPALVPPAMSREQAAQAAGQATEPEEM